MASKVEEFSSGRFYGVYLLCSQNPEKRYNGKCYIGFTVNPKRRITQHNRGKDFGGARKTNNKGPWDMVIIIHGFPNNISALQFEWAWQQPALTSRLKAYPELKRKQSKETHFQYNFRILSRMLNVGPWNRLPLIIRWLEPKYECSFQLFPPSHMAIESGKIVITKEKKNKDSLQSQPRVMWASECHLCMGRIENPERSRIGCLNNLCKLTCHMICLANYMISSDLNSPGHYIPLSSTCPLCETDLSWGALLQHKRKLLGIPEEGNYDEDDDSFDEISDCELGSDSDNIKDDSSNLVTFELSD